VARAAGPVSGSDVYVVGSTYNSPANNGQPGSSVITWWKNGVATTLPGNGTANAIAMVAP
jgi:hypothetical protein